MKHTDALTVFLVMNDLPAQGGTCGMELVVPELVRYGHRFCLFVRNPVRDPEDNQYLSVFSDSGVPVIEGPRARGHLGDLAFLTKIIRWSVRRRPSVSHVLRADSAWVIPALRRIGMRVLYTEATNPGPMLANEWWYPNLGRFLRHADRVIVPNSAIRDALLRFHGLSVPLTTVPFPVVLPPRESLRANERDEQLVIGTTGRLEFTKGLDTLLDAAALVLSQRDDVRFELHGEGSQESSLREQAQALGLGDHVVFKGAYQVKDDLDAIMAGLDVFVLPTLLEGLPSSILEAMAFAKPVITTTQAGVGDLATDGQEALIVEPSSPQALADAILRLADTPSLATSLGQAARDRIEHTCAVPVVSNRLLNLYRAVGERRSRFASSGTLLEMARAAGSVRAYLPGDHNRSGLHFFFRWAEYGGAEQVHQDIVQLFEAEHPWVFISEGFGADDRRRYPPSTRLIDLRDVPEGSLREAYLIGRYRTQINRHPGAVVLGSGSRFFSGLLPFLGSRVRKLDLFHGPGLDLERSARDAAFIDRRIVVDQSVATALEDVYLRSGAKLDLLDRVTVIPNGVAIPPSSRSGAQGSLRVLFVGRGCEEKRVHLAGRISRRLHDDQGTGMTFVGDNESWVDESDRPYCRFLGPLDGRESVGEVMMQSDVIVSTSSVEGLPLAVLEAMSHGVVPVVTPAGGLSDCVSDSVNGRLVVGDDEDAVVDEVAARLRDLANDRQDLERLSNAARETVSHRYSTRAFSDAYRELLSGVDSDRRDPYGNRVGTVGISILVYRFGHGGLDRTLASIADSGFDDYEVRIIDDCSHDGDTALAGLAERGNVHVSRHDRFVGYAASIGSLLQWSRGTISILLGCGDTVLPSGLQTVWDRYNEAPHNGVFQFPVPVAPGNGDSIRWSQIIPLMAESELDFGRSCIAVRTDLARQVVFAPHMNEIACHKWLELTTGREGSRYTDSVVCESISAPAPVYLDSDAYIDARISIARQLLDDVQRGDDAADTAVAPEVATSYLDDITWSLSVTGHHRAAVPIVVRMLRSPARSRLLLRRVIHHGVRALRPSSFVTRGQESRNQQLPRRYPATDPMIQRNTGSLEGERVVCKVGRDQPGHCSFGPGFRVRESGPVVLTVAVRLTGISDPDQRLINIDVFDRARDRVITEIPVTGRQLSEQDQDIEVPFVSEVGQVLEFRVWWDARCDLELSGLHARAQRGDSVARPLSAASPSERSGTRTGSDQAETGRHEQVGRATGESKC